MKVAQLHDGTAIHFPEGTPDAHMDMVVQKLHGAASSGGETATPVPAMDPALVSFLVNAVSSHMKQMTDAKESSAQDVDHNTELHLTTAAAKVEAIESASKSLASSIDSVVKPLTSLADNSKKIEAMTKAVERLTEAVNEGVSHITRVLMAPRRSTIEHDNAGKPQMIVSRSLKEH